MDSIRERIENLAPHLDKADFGFAVILAFAIGLTVYWNKLSGAHAIAMVTAVTALAGIYQLRHPTHTVRPAVREDFQAESDTTDFGLRNCGPGPALYIQIVAKVDGNSHVRLKPQNPPIHLSEGDFVGLQYDSRTDGELWDDSESANESEKEIELFYSYVTEQGLREPVSLNLSKYEDSQCLFDEITDDDQDPRTIDLETVKKGCSSAN